MSDYANLREQLYEAMLLLEGGGGETVAGGQARSGDRRQGGREMSPGLQAELEAYRNRNPEPKVEPALMQARTQAEWHQAQQALVVAETPPEELAMAMGVSDGVEPSKQQGERMHEQRAQQAAERTEQAKRDVEEMRQGQFRAGGIGRSAPQPASTPGTVPAPVQGQTPPIPGRETSQTPTHQESHEQTAEAHRQAAQIHGEAAGNPTDPAQHDVARAAHEEQAALHAMEAQGQPGAPEAALTDEQRQRQEEERKKAQEAQQRQQQAPKNGNKPAK